MDFKDLYTFLNNVKETKGPNEKAKFVREFLTNLRQTVTKEEIFPILRLIVPKLDRERQSYNMKESKISRVLVKMLSLPNGNDKDVLTKSYLMAGQASDFGDVVYSVIRKYLSNCKTTLTINELNAFLDDLTNRKNEVEAENVLMKIFRKCSPEHIKWIIRIILKELKLGIDPNRILNCFHRDGASFYCSNNNLKKVFEVLSDVNVNLHELEIEIFEAFRPMLSKRIDAANFKKEFQDNKLYYIENKFDGERFQIHMQNNEFMYFSRNGFNYTSTYGSTYEDGIFTPKLKNLLKSNVNKIILDGEMMLWNKVTKKLGSKGMTLDVKKLNEDGKYQPCFCVYDIILLNDNILTNKPLKERVKILQSVFTGYKPGTLALSEIKEIRGYQQIVDELNTAVNNYEEGIIVKDPNSIYKYSDRNSGWYKMKLEYFQNVMNDLDLIVMGGIYASSTSDTLNSFIVGIRSGVGANGKPMYISFGKVSSGLNDEELKTINQKIKTEGYIFDKFDNENMSFGKEKPNYYINPENSFIFVVRATELTRSNDNSFKTPYVLRFPRILKVRHDKPVDECLNVNELFELCKSNKYVVKLNKSNVSLEEILATKRVTKKRKIEIPTFTSSAKVTDLLEGYNIHVFNGSSEKSKEDTENIIQRAGGTVAYRINDKVDIILVGTNNAKVKEITSKRNKYDVVSVDWLYRTIQEGNLLGYETHEVYGIGYNYKNCLTDELDLYGDNFTEDATVESLKHCFGIIQNLGESCNMNGTVSLKGRKNFSEYIAYFDKYQEINNEKSNVIYKSFLDEIEFQYYCGEIHKNISKEVNIVINNGDKARQETIQNYLDLNHLSHIEIKTKDFLYKQIN